MTQTMPAKKTLPKTMTAAANRYYRIGFRAGSGGADLDEAETRYLGHPNYNDWLDGYLDAANREFGHIPNCPGHSSNECGEA